MQRTYLIGQIDHANCKLDTNASHCLCFIATSVQALPYSIHRYINFLLTKRIKTDWKIKSQHICSLLWPNYSFLLSVTWNLDDIIFFQTQKYVYYTLTI